MHVPPASMRLSLVMGFVATHWFGACGSRETPTTPTATPVAGSNALVVEADSPAIVGGQLSEAVGIETLGGVLTPLLPAGCRVPCVSTESFSTASDEQAEISIFYFRGNATMAADAHPLGQFRIEGIPPMPRGTPQIEVTLTAPERDLLVEAHDATSNSPIRLVRVP